jgi:nuclear cap-binding protein subunit 1
VVGEEAVEARIRLLAAEPEEAVQGGGEGVDEVPEATDGEAQMSLA